MKRSLTLLLVVFFALSCSRETAVEKVEGVKQAAKNVVNIHGDTDVGVPVGAAPTKEAMEQERFNAEWQRLKSFEAARQQQAARAAQQQQPAGAPAANVQFVAAGADAQFGETMTGLTAQSIAAAPVRVPIKGDVSGPSVIRTQILLDRNNYSVGAIDGRWGKNSAIAVYWFQRENGLPPTGDVDEATYRALLRNVGGQPLVTTYQLTQEDLKGPFTKIPDDVYDQQKMDCLCYETKLEALAEKFHVEQALFQTMNAGVDFESLQAGSSITVPVVRTAIAESAPEDVAKIVVSVKGSYLHALAADGRLLFHAPTTLGSKYDPSPNETTKIVGIAHDPHFHYQPKLFADVSDDKPEAHLQPGPNSPVGLVWMALSKPHFGIHGTNNPETIGYASSHGCVRLPNWDARDLAYRTATQTTVEFLDTRGEGGAEPSSAAAKKSTN